MSTTPTTPQWADFLFRKWVSDPANNGEYQLHLGPDETAEFFRDLAKHAPPLSPPADEAKLREVIRNEIQWAKDLSASGFIASNHQINCLTDRILTALAPHLAQREPGEVLRGKLMSAGDLTLLEDQNAIEETGVFVKCTREALRALSGNLVYEEVEIRKSAQRGEGKP